MRDYDDVPRGLTYWQKRDEWAAVGRKIGDLWREARCLGCPVANIPGAPALIERFKALGKELDRHVR